MEVGAVGASDRKDSTSRKAGDCCAAGFRFALGRVGVKLRRTQPEHILSALPPLATGERTFRIGSFVPCVDGSELARAFFTFAALVGAAMCSAC